MDATTAATIALAAVAAAALIANVFIARGTMKAAQASETAAKATEKQAAATERAAEAALQQAETMKLSFHANAADRENQAAPRLDSTESTSPGGDRRSPAKATVRNLGPGTAYEVVVAMVFDREDGPAAYAGRTSAIYQHQPEEIIAMPYESSLEEIVEGDHGRPVLLCKDILGCAYRFRAGETERWREGDADSPAWLTAWSLPTATPSPRIGGLRFRERS